MSELLTTWKMAELLKVGEIAECVENRQCRAIKRADGAIVWEDETDRFVTLNVANMKSHWRILPKYVSVHEAFSKYFEGKTIVSHMDEIEGVAATASFTLNDGRNALAMDKDRIRLGKWTIQEEGTK